MSMLSLRTRLFLRSLLLQAGFSDERRQGLGFAWAVDPALRMAYSSVPEALKAARLRHLAAFNIEPHAVGLPLGVVASLEQRAGSGDMSAVDAAVRLKNTLGTSLSAAADAFFWGALRPLACAVAFTTIIGGIFLKLGHPVLTGVLVGLALFNAPALWVRWKGLSLGLAQSERACVEVSCLPVQSWIHWTRIAAGLLVAAGAAAGCVAFSQDRVVLAFVFGVILSHRVGGPLALVAAAGVFGAAQSLIGRLP